MVSGGVVWLSKVKGEEMEKEEQSRAVAAAML